MAFGINPVTGRPGPAPLPPRDGDRKQARQRVNVEVRTGRRPHPNSLPCNDCGHVWRDGERRHEYDHHKGYAAEHHLDVVPLCTTCHARRSAEVVCARGHARVVGSRRCDRCVSARKSLLRDAAWWRARRAKKKAGV